VIQGLSGGFEGWKQRTIRSSAVSNDWKDSSNDWKHGSKGSSAGSNDWKHGSNHWKAGSKGSSDGTIDREDVKKG